ncbi:hypothetical protein [Paraburkholderia acidisoli]|uniref:DUF2235 domain-containing protein n=1 Tax=Paraburkholderia acidisoli TaxID=2571748 RepID=A0A7Z2JK98_9BURK|nr:hypothetical protein [Paraburkholderia acidisoli]QGZ66084.1 hypothetical protein FAZ98_30165 [Paraburkholderia acidisoli]
MEYGLFDESPAEREVMQRAAKAAQPTPPTCKTCRQRVYASFFFDDLGRNETADESVDRLSNVARLFRAHPSRPADWVHAFYYSGLGTPFDDTAEAAFALALDKYEDAAKDHAKDSVKDAVKDEAKEKAKDAKNLYVNFNRTVAQKRAALAARARQLEQKAGRVRRAAAQSGKARAQKAVARGLAAEAGEMRRKAATVAVDELKSALRESVGKIKRTSIKSLVSKKAIVKLAAGVSIDLIPATRDNAWLSQLMNLGPDIRLETAKEELELAVKDAVTRQQAERPVQEIFVSVFGCGRGGALAKAFANAAPSSVKGDINGVKYEVSVKLQYIGLFDAMHAMSGSELEFFEPTAQTSFFAPNNPLWFFSPVSPTVNMDDRDLQLAGFAGGLHLIAGQENRPWQRLSLNSGNDRVKQIVVAGIHEDVSGGYVDGEDGRHADFARASLLAMYAHAIDWGVPFFGTPAKPGFKTRDGQAMTLQEIAPDVQSRFFQATDGVAEALKLHQPYLAYVGTLGGAATESIDDQLKAHHMALLHWVGYAQKNLPGFWAEAQKSVDAAIARAADLLSQVRGEEPVAGKHVSYTADGIPFTTYDSDQDREADEKWQTRLGATTSLNDDLKTQREHLGTLKTKIDHDVKAMRERSSDDAVMMNNAYMVAKVGIVPQGAKDAQNVERKWLAAWDNAILPLPASLVPLFQKYLHDPVVSGTGDYTAVGLLYLNQVSYFSERGTDVGEKQKSTLDKVKSGWEATKKNMSEVGSQIAHMFD